MKQQDNQAIHSLIFQQRFFFNISIAILMLFGDCFHMNHNGFNIVLWSSIQLYFKNKLEKSETPSIFSLYTQNRGNQPFQSIFQDKITLQSTLHLDANKLLSW